MLAANATDIGNIVRRRRTKANLTQGELAKKIGVSRKWIADLEGGHPRAQLQLVLDVLSALDAIVDVRDSNQDISRRSSGAPVAESTYQQASPSNGEISLPAGVLDALRIASEARYRNQGLSHAIRNALVHLDLDKETTEALWRISKELAREEASQAQALRAAIDPSPNNGAGRDE